MHLKFKEVSQITDIASTISFVISTCSNLVHIIPLTDIGDLAYTITTFMSFLPIGLLLMAPLGV